MTSHMVDKDDISNNLIKLGLSEKEILIYLALIDVDSSTILELNKKTGIARSTVYNTAKSLANQGFGEWVVEQHRQKIKAIRPKQLDFIVNEKETEFITVKSAISDLQTMISDRVPKLTQTQVRYYPGIEGMKQMLWNSLKAKKCVIGYSEFGRINIVGKKFYNDYVFEFQKRKISDQVIANESCLDYTKKYIVTKTNKHQLHLDNIRYIPKSIYYVTGDHSIYNNVYAMSYWQQGEIVGVEIENKEFTKLHTSIFNMLWKIAKPISEIIE